MARVEVLADGHIVLPPEIRDRLGLKPGDVLDLGVRGNAVELRVRRRRLTDFRGAFAQRATLDSAEERRRAWDAQTGRLIEHAAAPVVDG